MAATYSIPCKLLFYLAFKRKIHGQLYLLRVLLGLGKTDRRATGKNSVHAHPAVKEERKRKWEKRDIFSPRKDLRRVLLARSLRPYLLKRKERGISGTALERRRLRCLYERKERTRNGRPDGVGTWG